MSSALPTLTLLTDYLEENWISMEFCAEMLLLHLQTDHAHEVAARRYCPPWQHLFRKLPVLGRKHLGFNLDRMWNRYHRYPRQLKPVADSSFFHVVDHSYAHLAHALPPEITGVACWDLNAFRPIFDPANSRSTRFYRRMAGKLLKGLQRAHTVFYASDAVRSEMLAHSLIDPARLVKAPLGVAREYTAEAPSGWQPAPGVHVDGPYLLHVGSCVPRKRIEVFLEVGGQLCARNRDLKIVKVGGKFTDQHQAIIAKHNLSGRLIHRHNLPREEVAHLYRHAAATLMTSDNEGFGIPVIEALACGSPVVISEMPVFREVGGDAVTYCPIGDVSAWVETLQKLLDNPAFGPNRTTRLHRASLFSWQAHAQAVWGGYKRLLQH